MTISMPSFSETRHSGVCSDFFKKQLMYIAVLVCSVLAPSHVLLAQTKLFSNFSNAFMDGYKGLSMPETEMDYKVNFSHIKNAEDLKKQEAYFKLYTKLAAAIDTIKLSQEESLRYHQIQYEIRMNLCRIELEQKWDAEGRKTPENGLHSMSNYKDWYGYYVKHFTSMDISPEQVYAMGDREVKKIQHEIKIIETHAGYSDDKAFYQFLQTDTFYLHDSVSILNRYAQIDKTVRSNLSKLFPHCEVPEVRIIEWPHATASTPPGMYMDKENSPSGKAVFQFNYYGEKHNVRAMDWLYMHEGIPGHHLQYVIRSQHADSLKITNSFFYFGNAEGWGCYVEDFGKEMGLYQNDYTYLGKWQWDLVRSARLVMEVGIHYYGWSRDKALQYWKDNIKGQDEIAEREITRITNWPGQALCYKVGALTMKKIVAAQMKQGKSIVAAHQYLLQHSDFPLQVL